MIFLSLFFTICSVRGQFAYYYTTGIPGQVYTSPFQQFIQPQLYYQTPIIPTPFSQQQIQAPKTPSTSPKPQQPAAITHKIPNIYRGFGYHTAYDDGASATVVFFSGPQPNDQRITLASDMLDPQSSKDVSKKISEAIAAPGKESTQHELPTLTPIIRALFQNPQPLNGVVNFYSAPGFPANTAPLAASGRSLNLNSTNLTTSENSKPDEETAESIVNLFQINSVDNYEKFKSNLNNQTQENVTETSTSTEKFENVTTTIKSTENNDSFIINVDEDDANTTENLINETTTTS